MQNELLKTTEDHVKEIFELEDRVNPEPLPWEETERKKPFAEDWFVQMRKRYPWLKNRR